MNESQPIGQYLNHFYNNNPEFGEEGGINERWAWLEFGFFSIPFPNFKSRSEILYLHDLNHIINNYDTSWKGEISVSAWEISSGMGRFLTGWLFAGFAFGFGMFIYPRLAYKAFMRGTVTKSLLVMDLPKPELLKLSLKELKQRTGHANLKGTKIVVGLAEKISFILMALVFTLFFLSPFAVGSAIFYFIISSYV